MRKITGVLVALLIGLSIVYAEKVADLPDVIRPASINLGINSVYITDQAAIHLYSLEPFKQIKTFGVQGQGPGEFNSTPSLKVYPERLFINCLGKIMRFTHDGKFIEQKSLPFRLFHFYYPILQVGLNYVAFPMIFHLPGQMLPHRKSGGK